MGDPVPAGLEACEYLRAWGLARVVDADLLPLARRGIHRTAQALLVYLCSNHCAGEMLRWIS